MLFRSFYSANSVADHPPLQYPWKPEYPVIPSLPNQADEIISGIQKLVGALNEVNIEATQKKFDSLLSNLNILMSGNGKDNAGLVQSVKDMNVILERIAKVTDKDELTILMRELIGTMVAIRQTVTSIDRKSTRLNSSH